MQTNPNDLSAAYLISVLNKNKISYDDAIAHVLAHAASFKCPRLGIIIRAVFAGMRHNKTGHSQTRHVRKTLGAFWHSLSRDQRDHPANITPEDVMKFLARWDGDAPKTWNEAFAYITSTFALAVERRWLVVSPCACIKRKRRENGTGGSQLRHVRCSLADFVTRISKEKAAAPELITEQDCADWLKRWAPPHNAKKSWNEKRGYLHGMFLYAVTKDYLARAPTAGLKRFRIKHTRVPAVLTPVAAQRLMSWLEDNAPEWIPYYVFCLFAGVRPDVREGEAHRLDHDTFGELVQEAEVFYRVCIHIHKGVAFHPSELSGPIAELTHASRQGSRIVFIKFTGPPGRTASHR